jgi:hypothetical protein
MGNVRGNGSYINQLWRVAYSGLIVSVVSGDIAGMRDNDLLQRELTNPSSQIRQISNIFERR